jgi:multicomponent Na+:H+ antiporter subunit D
MTLGVLLGLAMAKNFVTLYMFFEFMSLITVPLVLHNGTSEARRPVFSTWGIPCSVRASRWPAI